MDLDALARTPSPESWRLLCEQLQKLPVPAAIAAIASLEAPLAKWPDELRATMCGMTWDDEFFDGQPNPRSTIVRYLRYDRYFSGRYDHSLRTRSRAVNAATMRAMCASEGVRFLTRVNFSYQLDASGVRELARCKHFAALKVLEVDGCRLDGNALAELASAEFYGRLDRLDMSNCEITERNVALLFAGASAPKEIDLGSNRLGPDGAAAIVRHVQARPQRLSLGGCQLGDHGARVLASCKAELERLHVGDNGITDDGLAALVGGTLRVRELAVAQSRIGPRGVEALVAAEWPLVALDLHDNALDDTAAELIATRGPATLAKLDVSDNDLTADGLVALIGSERLAGLTRLDAGTNRIGVFPRTIAATTDRLEALHLEHNRLGDGIRSLAAIASDALVDLDLSHNAIGIREFEELTGAPWFSRLTRLRLANNPLGSGAGVVFGAWTAIEELDLSRTDLGDAGACALVEAGIRPVELSLDGCGLGDEALERLVKSPAIARLAVLNVRHNAITERGVKALLAAAPKSLKQIRVDGNRIADAGIVALAGWTQLLHVGAGGNPYGKAGEQALEARPVRCCP